MKVAYEDQVWPVGLANDGAGASEGGGVCTVFVRVDEAGGVDEGRADGVEGARFRVGEAA
ncbi:hypothetical protein [Streptomyces tubercidicus]